MPTTYIALDAETTGTDPDTDRIVELSLQEVDDRLHCRHRYGQRIDPGIPIPDTASRIHGIHDADVAGEPRFEQVASHVQALLENTTIIAYNGARFDVPLLHNELVRAGQPGLQIDHPVIDPYALFIQDQPRTLTGALRFYLDQDHPEAHSAAADVHAMLQVLRAQRYRRDNPDLQALALQPDHRWLDWNRCFYRDDQEAIRFGFGKHRNQPAANHPDYLHWMTRSDFPEDTTAVAKSLLVEVLA